jgi:hypothetical protein
MSNTKPETVFDMSALFVEMNRSFTTAALQLREEFKKPEWLDAPYTYHMPRMQLSMKMVLSHTDGKVKGVFNKDSTEASQELTSTIDVELVAVPRGAVVPLTPAEQAERDAAVKSIVSKFPDQNK